jgi:hypothetical protein
MDAPVDRQHHRIEQICSGRRSPQWWPAHEQMEHLPFDELFQTTEDLFVAEPLFSTTLCAGPCGLVVPQPNDGEAKAATAPERLWP